MEIFFFRDLKRDVAKKLEKLEKRTQKAIVELIRECRYSFNIFSVYIVPLKGLSY